MKKTISKVKRQLSEWEKIIANEATDKESISEICSSILHLGQRTKWAKELNRRFSIKTYRWLTNT